MAKKFKQAGVGMRVITQLKRDKKFQVGQQINIQAGGVQIQGTIISIYHDLDEMTVNVGGREVVFHRVSQNQHLIDQGKGVSKRKPKIWAAWIKPLTADDDSKGEQLEMRL